MIDPDCLPTTKKGILQLIIFVVAIIAVLIGCYFFIRMAIKSEASKAKTEMIQKVKSVNFNEDSVALKIAKTIHKITSFRSKVKGDLDSLNDADSSIKGN